MIPTSKIYALGRKPEQMASSVLSAFTANLQDQSPVEKRRYGTWHSGINLRI